jgi:hypothetical protein
MKLHFLKITLAAALVLGMAPDSQADVMVSNLSQPATSNFPVGAWWAANQFITDNSAAAFQLDLVTIAMDAANATPGNFFVAIYSGAGDRPGTLLQTLIGSSNPDTAGDYTYSSPGLTLTPNTSYWVVTGVSNGGSAESGYLWRNTGAVVNYTGPWIIPSIDTHITSLPAGGSTWNNFENDGYARQFSVSATAVVPEPSTCILVCLGAAGLLLRLRKRG